MVAKSETFLGSLEDLRAFCAVVDFTTISAAARHLGETKGSVSRRIARLEKALGVVLLARTSRAVMPSKEGLEFYHRCVTAISLLDEAAGVIRNSKSVLRGTIRMTAPIDIAVEVLPEIIAAFRKSQPEIQVEIVATDAVLDLTANGIDLALRAGPGSLPDTAYQAPVVARGTIGIFAAPDYFIGRQLPQSPSDLTCYDLVLPRERPNLKHVVLSNGIREEKVALRAAVRASDLACVLRLVIAGTGVALLPTIITKRWLERGYLLRLLPDWEWSGFTLHAVTASGEHLPARVRAFRDFLREGLHNYIA